MTDIVDKMTRSRMMSGIRGKDTKPELVIRHGLHRRGFRFTLHNKNISGRPDLVFPKYNALVLVNGCFWHGHDCHLFKWPGGERADFWREKIESNVSRDKKLMDIYASEGWRVAVVWECALKGRAKLAEEEPINLLEQWLRSKKHTLVVQGTSQDQS